MGNPLEVGLQRFFLTGVVGQALIAYVGSTHFRRYCVLSLEYLSVLHWCGIWRRIL